MLFFGRKPKLELPPPVVVEGDLRAWEWLPWTRGDIRRAIELAYPLEFMRRHLLALLADEMFRRPWCGPSIDGYVGTMGERAAFLQRVEEEYRSGLASISAGVQVGDWIVWASPTEVMPSVYRGPVRAIRTTPSGLEFWMGSAWRSMIGAVAVSRESDSIGSRRRSTRATSSLPFWSAFLWR